MLDLNTNKKLKKDSTTVVLKKKTITIDETSISNI